MQNDDDTCEARPGAFDDFVAGPGIGLTVAVYKTLTPRREVWTPTYYRKQTRTINRAVS